MRDSVVVYTGRSDRCAGSRKTPARSAHGYECGITIEGYSDLKEGDIIEAFEIETMAATLDAAITDKPGRR